MKKKFFIINTKLLIVETIFSASRMSQFWEAFCVWQCIAIIQFLGKALEFVSIFLGVYKNQYCQWMGESRADKPMMIVYMNHSKCIKIIIKFIIIIHDAG